MNILVRTNFPNFREKEECDKDRQELLKQNQELSEIINSCNGIIYVDNPSINNKKRARLNQEKREESRRIVLDHLAENCPEIYPFGEWNSIYQLVDDYIKEREKIEKGDSPTQKEDLKKIKSEVTEKIKVNLAKELPIASIEYSIQNK